MNEMRDRLIELVKKADSATLGDTYESYADYLIANGVILPPCKVGDINYTIGKFTGQIIPNEVKTIEICKNDMYLINENYTVASVEQQLGKTVFLTREEAEAKLKECEGK